MPKELTPLKFEVGSHSMWPLLRQHDHILIRPLIDKKIRPGQVAAFAVNHRLVCHRVLKIVEYPGYPARYFTRGDLAISTDPSLSGDEIWGRVVGVQGAPFRSLWLGPLAPVFLFWVYARDQVLERVGVHSRSGLYRVIYLAFFPWAVFRPGGKFRSGPIAPLMRIKAEI